MVFTTEGLFEASIENWHFMIRMSFQDKDVARYCKEARS